ncbi:cytochrome c3 family protein [Sutterella sp.]|uniref:cytochrome c3 family protein n=1 Tax=Sutterella sp. TaxID=1981025 RepID=UPI0026DFCF94|nr:cytochrome c3 family protein [Sutterella sp.]MDO5531545.1 cytochrome c3 family protein [Sutterella sp.]
MKNAILAAILAAVSFTANAADAAISKDMCIACHGSFDSIIEKNVQVDADPAPVNPHKYVPHTDKKAENVWECTTCHTPHAMPPQKGAKAEANIEQCYSCHHQFTFEKCSSCHS